MTLKLTFREGARMSLIRIIAARLFLRVAWLSKLGHMIILVRVTWALLAIGEAADAASMWAFRKASKHADTLEAFANAREMARRAGKARRS